jgi:hypothetical protein
MILDHKTLEYVKSANEAIISFIDDDGYPYSLRSQFVLKEPENVIEMKKPKALIQKIASQQKACVLFHYHDDKLKEAWQLLLKGVINEEGDTLAFTTQHAWLRDMRGMKAMLEIMSFWRGKANRYFEKRKMKRPDFKYKPDPEFWAKYKK